MEVMNFDDPIDQMPVWQIHFIQRTFIVSWVTFLAVLWVYSYMQDVVPAQLSYRINERPQFEKAKGFVFKLALIAAIAATALWMTIGPKVAAWRKRIKQSAGGRVFLYVVYLPIKWLFAVALFVCTLVNMIVMTLTAVVAGLFFGWYNPSIFKAMNKSCISTGLCEKNCGMISAHCCLRNFDDMHEWVFELVRGNTSSVQQLTKDVPKSLDIGALKEFLTKHPFTCVSHEDWDVEEEFASKGKKLALTISITLLVTSLLYNAAAVYSFEVQNGIMDNLWQPLVSKMPKWCCCPYRRPELTQAQREEQLRFEAEISEADRALAAQLANPRYADSGIQVAELTEPMLSAQG